MPFEEKVVLQFFNVGLDILTSVYKKIQKYGSGPGTSDIKGHLRGKQEFRTLLKIYEKI